MQIWFDIYLLIYMSSAYKQEEISDEEGTHKQPESSPKLEQPKG